MFERAEQRSEELEASYELLDRWKSKSNELLYSMIPQTVADRLRDGVSPLDTCEVIKKLFIFANFLIILKLGIPSTKYNLLFYLNKSLLKIIEIIFLKIIYQNKYVL